MCCSRSAASRTPATSGWRPQESRPDKNGNIVVDDSLSTSVAGIYALGDCNGRGAFTHTAYNDFEIVAANLLDGAKRKVSDRILGYALYTDPPLGRVGMSETEARKSGRKILVSKRPMTRVSRAVEKGDTRGFMKLVADAETKKILGAAILGISGDEAIHGILDMMNAGVDYTTLQWAVPIHPTVSELIPTVIGDLKPQSVARMKRSEIRDARRRPHCASLHAGYEPPRIERRKIDSLRRAVDDQLRHRLAGRRRVQNAPDAVARRDVGAGDTRHFSDQRKAILRDRPIAGLARENFC